MVTTNRPSSQRNHHRRSDGGTTLAEMPLALWIIIVGICFPILMLAIMTVRYGFFWNACRQAAQQAAKCPTFQNDSSQGKSAVNTADTVASMAASSFNGISIVNPVHVYIVQTDVSAGSTSTNADRQMLAAAADTDKNIYEIQVSLDGLVAPIVPISTFGNIPGLTSPFPVNVKAQYSCEVPQGLNQ
ncbi:MAG TPA: hypothetical protein V6C89_03920 [Drouetiella sp.]